MITVLIVILTIIIGISDNSKEIFLDNNLYSDERYRINNSVPIKEMKKALKKINDETIKKALQRNITLSYLSDLLMVLFVLSWFLPKSIQFPEIFHIIAEEINKLKVNK